MSTEQKASSEPKEKDAVTAMLDAGKRVDVNLLEEDDEFEEFDAEDWQVKCGDGEADEDVNVWEDNWDDESIEDDFSKQLRAELEKQGHRAPA